MFHSFNRTSTDYRELILWTKIFFSPAKSNHIKRSQLIMLNRDDNFMTRWGFYEQNWPKSFHSLTIFVQWTFINKPLRHQIKLLMASSIHHKYLTTSVKVAYSLQDCRFRVMPFNFHILSCLMYMPPPVITNDNAVEIEWIKLAWIALANIFQSSFFTGTENVVIDIWITFVLIDDCHFNISKHIFVFTKPDHPSNPLEVVV